MPILDHVAGARVVPETAMSGLQRVSAAHARQPASTRTCAIPTFVALAVVACSSAPESFRAAAVLASAVDDHSFSQSLEDALLAVRRGRGEDGFEFAQSASVAAGAPAQAALRDYAKQGFALVIAHGLQYRDDVRAVARAFPRVAFALGTTSETFASEGLSNVFAYEARAEEGGYVNGVMAARLSRSGILGVIGPIATGDAKRYVDGFLAGARATNPAVDVRVTYTGSFEDVALAARTAQAQLDAGADVLTGSGQMVVGAIAKAKEHHALWFGTQFDQAPLAPDIVVACQLYRWEAVLDEMAGLVEGGLRGNRVFSIGLADAGEVVQFNAAYPIASDVKALAEQTIRSIADGTLRVAITP